MAIYLCKCGRKVSKSTTAENTGNRDTAGCTGCPYLLPYGKFEYKPGGFRKDVQGYECRMSPSIDYTTTYMGQAHDKCTLRIVSLDLDFLDEVQAWINAHADGNLSGGFSREDMRGTDFSNNGRYSWSIACAQNRKGMAAKAALIEHFFGPDRRRLDKTQAEEKAIVLAAIEVGKAKANKKEKKMDYIISECEQNDLLYAYYKKEFWFWDEHQNKWVVSDFARARFEKALQTSPQLTPEDFMTNGDEFWELDEWEVSTEQINALKLVKVERKSTESDRELIKDGTDARRQVHSRARIECGSISAVHVCDKKPDDVKIWLNAMAPAEYWVLNSGDDPCGEHIEVCPYCGANLKDGAGDVLIVPFPHVAQSQQDCENAAEVQQAGSETSEDASISASIAKTLLVGNALESFDFSELGELAGQAAEADEQFNLHYGKAQDEYLVACIYLARIHELTAKAGRYGGGTWTAWYQSKGISEGSARTMVQNGDGFKSATLADLKNIPVLTKKDLNLIAREGAADKVIEAASEGNQEQIQGILLQLKAAQEAKEKAEKKVAEMEREAAFDRKERDDANAAALRYKNECDRRAKDQQRVEELLKTTTERAENAEAEAHRQRCRAEQAESDGDKMQDIVDDLQDHLDASAAHIKDLESGRAIEAIVVDQSEIDRRVQDAVQAENNKWETIYNNQQEKIRQLQSGDSLAVKVSATTKNMENILTPLLREVERSRALMLMEDVTAIDQLRATLNRFSAEFDSAIDDREDM